MFDSLFCLFLILWFIITGLLLCVWIIGNLITDRKKERGIQSNMSPRKRKFLIYLCIFIISCIGLYVIGVYLIDFMTGTAIACVDKENLREVIYAIGGGLLGAICYASLERIDKEDKI